MMLPWQLLSSTWLASKGWQRVCMQMNQMQVLLLSSSKSRNALLYRIQHSSSSRSSTMPNCIQYNSSSKRRTKLT